VRPVQGAELDHVRPAFLHRVDLVADQHRQHEQEQGLLDPEEMRLEIDRALAAALGEQQVRRDEQEGRDQQQAEIVQEPDLRHARPVLQQPPERGHHQQQVEGPERVHPVPVGPGARA
jgi:hypothetical protein